MCTYDNNKKKNVFLATHGLIFHWQELSETIVDNYRTYGTLWPSIKVNKDIGIKMTKTSGAHSYQYGNNINVRLLTTFVMIA